MITTRATKPLNTLIVPTVSGGTALPTMQIAKTYTPIKPPVVDLGISNSALIYPGDLPENGVRFAFSFYNWDRPAAFQQAVTTLDSRFPFIYLALPDQLQIAFSIVYQPFEGGFISSALGDKKSLPEMLSDFAASGGPTGELANVIEGMVGAAGYAILSRAKGAGGFSDYVDIISSYIGKAANPNTTLALKAPELRSHQLSWTFAPRNAKESDTVDSIITALETAFSPPVDAAHSFFLDYPNIVQPQFINSHDFLYNFKQCVITDFKVDYAAGGVPSFFNRTGAPTIVTIGVGLKEISMYTREDVGRTDSVNGAPANIDISLLEGSNELNVLPPTNIVSA